MCLACQRAARTHTRGLLANPNQKRAMAYPAPVVAVRRANFVVTRRSVVVLVPAPAVPEVFVCKGTWRT